MNPLPIPAEAYQLAEAALEPHRTGLYGDVALNPSRAAAKAVNAAAPVIQQQALASTVAMKGGCTTTLVALAAQCMEVGEHGVHRCCCGEKTRVEIVARHGRRRR